jgi:hypothetical protein
MKNSHELVARRRGCGLMLVGLLACGDEHDAGERASSGADDVSAGAVCGGVEQTCCTDTAAPCGRGLACDAETRVCRAPEGTAFCSTDVECAPDRRCCRVGTYATCQALGPTESCALPDLTVLSSGAGLTVEEELFDGLSPSPGGCVRERGVRQRLRASVAVANVGAADFVLGRADVLRSGSESAREDFLRYTLLDATGSTAATSRGPLPCEHGGDEQALACEQTGLAAGVIAPAQGIECELLDVTWLPPGPYRLRVELTRTWPDADPGNELLELPVELPSFDPLARCPPVDNPLQGAGPSRECGWFRAMLPTDGSCSPGELIDLECRRCAHSPILRICPGDGPCTSRTSLSTGLGYFPGEQGDGTCVTALATCPRGGRYNVLVASELTTEEASCTIALAPSYE